MILAGDLGGTKCTLALSEYHRGELILRDRQSFLSGLFSSPDQLILAFLKSHGNLHVATASLAVAGPVSNNRVTFTNLEWEVDGDALGTRLAIGRVLLHNDLIATSYGIDLINQADLYVLQKGSSVARGNRALFGVGTGVGEIILFWDGAHYVPVAAESGHADFAPRDELEFRLLQYLKSKYNYSSVSWELILGGRALREIHEFLDSVPHSNFGVSSFDSAPEILKNAEERSCQTCVQVMDLWASMYGAEAGNLALRALAQGGLYLAGGMSAKALFKLRDGKFLQEFVKKARFQHLLAAMPISVILNEDAPLLGAAYLGTPAL